MACVTVTDLLFSFFFHEVTDVIHNEFSDHCYSTSGTVRTKRHFRRNAWSTKKQIQSNRAKSYNLCQRDYSSVTLGTKKKGSTRTDYVHVDKSPLDGINYVRQGEIAQLAEDQRAQRADKRDALNRGACGSVDKVVLVSDLIKTERKILRTLLRRRLIQHWWLWVGPSF